VPKEKLTLSVDKEVVEKAKKLGINISEITEKVLIGYTSAKPEGSLHQAYKELFDSILPLLKEFDCKVKVAESSDYFSYEDSEGNEIQDGRILDETFLTEDGNYLVEPTTSPDSYYLVDITKIPREEFLTPDRILSNLVNELAKSQEKRKEKMEEILMAKRIIEAMSESLLKKQSIKEK